MHSSSGSASSGGGSHSRLLLHSLLGIVLGVGGGWLVLWLVFDTSKPKPAKPALRSQVRAQPRQAPAPRVSMAKLPLKELYSRGLAEAKQGQFGEALTWLHSHHKSLSLWLHLYWQLAEGLMKERRPLQAARLYHTLAAQRSQLWSLRSLQVKEAQALSQGGQKSKSKQLLQRAIKRSPKRPRGQLPWLRWREERLAFAGGLWLLSTLLTRRQKGPLLEQLWHLYPEHPKAREAKRMWFELWIRGLVRPRKGRLLSLAQVALDRYGDLARSKQLLVAVRRRRPRGRQKALYHRLLGRIEHARKRFRRANRQAALAQRSMRRSRRGLYAYRQAIQMKFAKRGREWRSTMRRLRRSSRYWYARALLFQGQYYAAQGRVGPAIRNWRGAWKRSRSRSLRMMIYLYRGLLQLRRPRRARIASRELRQAQRQFRRLRGRAKRQQPLFRLDYFQARAAVRRRQKRRAIRIYQRIATRAPLSLYGLLAAQRLQRLGKLSPLPFAKDKSFVWKAPQKPKSLATKLSFLLQYGPPALAQLELEVWAQSQRKAPPGVYIKISQLARQTTKPTVGLRWLYQIEKQVQRGKQTASRSFLLSLYPSPSQTWPKKMQVARQHRLDTRLVATLLLRLRGFDPDSRRAYLSSRDPRWLDAALPLPGPSTWNQSCQTLQALLQRMKGQVDLALEALLTGNADYAQKLGQTFPADVSDLRLPFLSKTTKALLRTYWTYQILHLR